MKLIYIIFVLLGILNSAWAQSEINTLVIYVRTGSEADDNDSISALLDTIGSLERSGHNVNGINYNYRFKDVNEIAQAVSYADNPPPGIARVMLVGHGTRNKTTGEYYRTIKDTTLNTTPFSEIDYKFAVFFACGVDGKTLSNDDFGNAAAKSNGHKYKAVTSPDPTAAPSGLSALWSASGPGYWTSISYYTEVVIISQPSPGHWVMEIIGVTTTVAVWVPIDEGPGDQNVAKLQCDDPPLRFRGIDSEFDMLLVINSRFARIEPSTFRFLPA